MTCFADLLIDLVGVLQSMVILARFGQQRAGCPRNEHRQSAVLEGPLVAGGIAGDADGDGRITVDEILRAVRNALEGCPLILGG